MVLTVMIFLNLVLAVTYNAYSESHGDQIKEMFTNRAKGLAEVSHTGDLGRERTTDPRRCRCRRRRSRHHDHGH